MADSAPKFFIIKFINIKIHNTSILGVYISRYLIYEPWYL